MIIMMLTTGSYPFSLYQSVRIRLVTAQGLVQGYHDGTFRPDAEITREEMAVILSRAIKYTGFSINLDGKEIERFLEKFADQDQISSWAKESIALAAKVEIINGYHDGTFAPNKDTTRAESVVMLARMLKLIGFIN
ncbi:MAG: hypothetical protein PWQ96_1344 [Clostridia bacterium]|nr:hypothetical protein [Clostridia bacterium]